MMWELLNIKIILKIVYDSAHLMNTDGSFSGGVIEDG